MGRAHKKADACVGFLMGEGASRHNLWGPANRRSVNSWQSAGSCVQFPVGLLTTAPVAERGAEGAAESARSGGSGRCGGITTGGRRRGGFVELATAGIGHVGHGAGDFGVVEVATTLGGHRALAL